MPQGVHSPPQAVALFSLLPRNCHSARGVLEQHAFRSDQRVTPYSMFRQRATSKIKAILPSRFWRKGRALIFLLCASASSCASFFPYPPPAVRQSSTRALAHRSRPGPPCAREARAAQARRGRCGPQRSALPGRQRLHRRVGHSRPLWLSQTSSRLRSPISGVAPSFDRYICLAQNIRCKTIKPMTKYDIYTFLGWRATRQKYVLARIYGAAIFKISVQQSCAKWTKFWSRPDNRFCFYR